MDELFSYYRDSLSSYSDAVLSDSFKSLANLLRNVSKSVFQSQYEADNSGKCVSEVRKKLSEALAEDNSVFPRRMYTVSIKSKLKVFFDYKLL